MSSDPLPVPEGSAKLREDADYEAVHAVLTATTRGRQFLTEYVARHGRSDTAKLAGVIANLEAAMREGLASQGSQAFARIVAELLAALSQIGAGLASDTSSTADVHLAVERIQDIAMALRQRDIEAALCDGLDAAIREVGDSIVRSEAGQARVHNAAAQLRELARRIADMTADAATAPAASAEAARLNDTGDRPLADLGEEASVAEEAGRPPLDAGVRHSVPRNARHRTGLADEGAGIYLTAVFAGSESNGAKRPKRRQAVAGSHADRDTARGHARSARGAASTERRRIDRAVQLTPVHRSAPTSPRSSRAGKRRRSRGCSFSVNENVLP